MKILIHLLQKEFKQIFRNKSIVAIIMVMPVVQLLIIPLAADYEVKNINLSVVDHDHSAYSRKLVLKITASTVSLLAYCISASTLKSSSVRRTPSVAPCVTNQMI